MIPLETLHEITDLIQTSVKKAKTYGTLKEDGTLEELTCRILALRILEEVRPGEDVEGLNPTILEMMQNANNPKRRFPGGKLFGDRFWEDKK